MPQSAANRPNLFGIDHASHPPAAAALKSENVRFVCRYLSTPGNPKNISHAEASELKLAGIDIVLVFETLANRALGGHAAGAADAESAEAQVGLVGLAGAPVYFAVDFDVQPAQVPEMLQYFHGAASVLGQERTGVYVGLAAVRAVLDSGACAMPGRRTRGAAASGNLGPISISTRTRRSSAESPWTSTVPTPPTSGSTTPGWRCIRNRRGTHRPTPATRRCRDRRRPAELRDDGVVDSHGFLGGARVGQRQSTPSGDDADHDREHTVGDPFAVEERRDEIVAPGAGR
jgi:Domain of unknown function (DUF1906)